MFVAFLVVAPFFWLGNPSGHDFEFHLNSWMEVLGQWKHWVLYPRWALGAHFGYGEARFIFYPPASWALGAGLGALLPWKIVPGAYVWLSLTLAGCSMFVLARRWLSPQDSLFAAALYAANPYHLVIIYWRSAYAELLAAPLLPILLLLALQSGEDGVGSAIPMGILVAAAWLINVPAAVIVCYSLAFLLVLTAAFKRKPKVLLYGALSLAIAFGLAAFYLVPAIYEQRWVDISQVLSTGLRPQENFLFTTLPEAEHDLFNRLVSVVACAEIAILAAAAVWSFRGRQKLEGAWRPLVAWAGLAVLLMLPVSVLAWRYFPELRFVQLPWRWLLCLNVPLALLLPVACRRWWSRPLAVAVMLGVIVFCWHRVQPPWWDTAADVAELQDNIDSGQGYEGTDEYVPAAADPYEINKDARRVTLDGPGTAQIHLRQWDAESRRFSADVSERTSLVLRLFNYPAWTAEVNGRSVATSTKDVTGQMIIPVQAGQNSVQVRFTRTWDRTAGDVISIVTALLLCGAEFMRRRRVVVARQ